ncbi:phospholipase D-like domain-containing protein [Falsiroseomonas sp.]|uniref:phospholipase D-like domain-containing protein n=1 Tax=Falsiroseomonas sp. TaxID=2870721 RepID=UPI003565CC41
MSQHQGATGFDEARVVRLFEEAIGTSFTDGNRIERLRNGDQIFPPMLDAIAGARRSVELLTYVYWTGEIAERFAKALADKAREGVPVKVLLDAWGAAPMADGLTSTMEEGGVELRWFRPLARIRLGQDLRRTHRKVLVVDGRVGFTGGVGIAKEWCGDARDRTEWRDDHFRVTGPAVRGLRAAFLGNWAEAIAEDRSATPIGDLLTAGDDEPARPGEARVQVVRSSASYGWSDVAAMVELAIGLATRSLRIATAYFTPDAVTTEALARAARRGVAVEILMPWPEMDMRVSQLAGSDQIAPLLEAGVTIHVFQPTMFHAKLILVDGAISILGSANFNRRSAWQDEEVCLVCLDAELAGVLAADWAEDVARSRPIELGRWRKRGFARRAREAAARLVRPMV